MALLFLQQVARGAVGNPSLASTVEVGVAPSICHLPAARRVRRVSHAKCLATLSFDIQTGGCPGSAVRTIRNATLGGEGGNEETQQVQSGRKTGDGPSGTKLLETSTKAIRS